MRTQDFVSSSIESGSGAAAARAQEAAVYARILANSRGFYVLRDSGELACLDSRGDLSTDAELSALLAEHLSRFLQAYRADPSAGQRRLAILYPTPGVRPWGTPTLRLEDWLVRQLYPVGGRAAAALTAFQRRQQESSVYRGMEVMLEVRHDVAPDTPVYCPVLFWRGDRTGDTAGPGAAEAIDVLDLFADVPLARRSDLPIQALAARLHRGLIDKGRRRECSFALTEAVASRADGGSAADAYGEIERDRRLDRRVTLPNGERRQPPAVRRVDSIERWLRLPHQPVRPDRLRQFAQFRALDASQLRALADRSLVYAAPAGTRLLEHGARDPWSLYLLDGSLMLTPEDQGGAVRVDGGSQRAAHPVAFLKPRKYAVEALTPVIFLWVHDLLLTTLLKQPLRA